MVKQPPKQPGTTPNDSAKGVSTLASAIADLRSKAMQSIHDGDSPRRTAASVSAFLTACSEDMESFRAAKFAGTHFDDKVVESINCFLPRRDEIVGVFLALAQQGDDDEAPEAIHGFLESLLPHTYFQGTGVYTEWDFDNFKFIAHELFLYAVACYIKHRRFTSAAYLIERGYYNRAGAQHNEAAMASFCIFERSPLLSLVEHGKRMAFRRSWHAHVLKERVVIKGLAFADLIIADFVLYLRGQTTDGDSWWPEILPYAERHSPLEFFLRCRSKKFFDKAKELLGVESKEALGALLVQIESDPGLAPEWDNFIRANLRGYLGYDQIATSP